jgi:BioD-like phosphotransacetylase family protein
VTRSLYIAAAQPYSGKSAVALGLYEHALRRSSDIAVFRPVVRSTQEPDAAIELLRSRGGVRLADEEYFGVTYADVLSTPDDAFATIIDRYRALAAKASAVLVIGTDFTDVGAPAELQFNARVAANLGSPVLFVVTGHQRSPKEVHFAIDLAADVLETNHASLMRVVVNRAEKSAIDEIRATVADIDVPVDVLPDAPLLLAPIMRGVCARIDGELLLGDPSLLSREAQGVVVAAMTLPNVLSHLHEGSVVVTPGDREDIVLATLSAHRSDAFPSLAGLVLTGGLRPRDEVWRLVEGVGARVADVSYFGTMMVHTGPGRRHGLRRRAHHRAHHPARPRSRSSRPSPALDRLQRVLHAAGRPGARLRRLRGQPQPDAEQLADIAVSSAETAAQFGVEPRVAMLSYSTGAPAAAPTSTRCARPPSWCATHRPRPARRGPAPVRRRRRRLASRPTKLPGSSVAGRATVFIFPDLNTGNNTYKAVQRSAGAVAIGPCCRASTSPSTTCPGAPPSGRHRQHRGHHRIQAQPVDAASTPPWG